MPNKSDGDDVIQEIALAAWSNRESVRNANSFKAWLLKIAVNKCNDFYRKHSSQSQIPLEEAGEIVLYHSRYGLTAAEAVQETLEQLGERDSQILRLFYMYNLPQAEISRWLGIPVGTVKSCLNTAKKRFKAEYPYPPKMKGDLSMNKLPEILPEYTIKRLDSDPFPVKWEELQGWFLIPRLGEKLTWALYDMPERTISTSYDMQVTGQAVIHGIKGVKIDVKRHLNKSLPDRNLDMFFIAQLTDTHSRFLAESHYSKDRNAQYFCTFLDGDNVFEDIGSFLDNWGFGEDNCGNEINIKPKGLIHRNGNVITTDSRTDSLDMAGRYAVTIGGKEYDCVCVMDVVNYNLGVVSEQFIDQNGRTILWRRFNRDDWKIDRYKQRWSERLPDNERLMVNNELYVHWYDCITDYIL